MFAEERQQEILQRARENGRVDVASLATELDVTPETVRRDLTALERAGLVRRVHGGAIPIERLGFEPALAARESLLTAEKERIAKAALAELPDERRHHPRRRHHHRAGSPSCCPPTRADGRRQLAAARHAPRPAARTSPC